MAAPGKKKARLALKSGRDLRSTAPSCPESGKPMVATLVVSNTRRMVWKCECGAAMPIKARQVPCGKKKGEAVVTSR